MTLWRLTARIHHHATWAGRGPAGGHQCILGTQVTRGRLEARRLLAAHTATHTGADGCQLCHLLLLL